MTDIEKLKAWCEKNYHRGADTMVECWDNSDYEGLLREQGSYTKALKILKDVAAVYRDRIADAENSIF